MKIRDIQMANLGSVMIRLKCDSEQVKLLGQMHDSKNIHHVVIRSIPKITGKNYDTEVNAEIALSGITGILKGRPLAYIGEKKGDFTHKVQPTEGAESEISSSGTLALPYHTDMAYLSFPHEDDHPKRSAAPDFLTLYCLENSHQIPTKVLSIAEIVKNLESGVLETLAKPLFDIRTPDSVKLITTVKNVPILQSCPKRGTMIRFNAAYCSAPEWHDEARLALAELCRVADLDSGLGDEVCLNPGDALVFNNRYVVHGRDEIPQSKTGGRKFRRAYSHRYDTQMNWVDASKCFVEEG